MTPDGLAQTQGSGPTDSASHGDEAHPGWLGTFGRWLGPAVFVAIVNSPAPDNLLPAGQRLLAVIVWMAIWWVTQAVPIAVTSLLPLVLFPLLGIQSAKTVSQQYLADSSFLYFGGFLIALGIERWGLHQRLALMTVNATGTTPSRIVLGFMLATFGLSMWISNSATTLLMLPIGVALLASLETLPGAETGSSPSVAADPHFRHLAIALTLGIAYAASIGGLSTLVGTPTNLAFVDIWNKTFPDQPAVSASQWMQTWTPFGLVFLFIAWRVLVWGLRTPSGFDRFDKSFFRERLRELGPMSRAERIMLLLFLITAMLWLFRTDFAFGGMTLVPGWERLMSRWLLSLGASPRDAATFVSDGTVAMAVATVMFLIPVERTTQGPSRRLMDWETASRVPWGILLLFGGGFAIAGAFEATKLSHWIGEIFRQQVEGQPTWVLVTAVCTALTFLTEFTSNVATVNTVLPIIAAAAVALDVDPRLLMIPATVSASCAFMLPIGTPPNAIVFGTGRIRMSQMAGYGLILNLIGIVLAVIAVYTLMVPQLGIVAK